MTKLRFIIFLLTVSLIYFAIHFFVFIRISKGLGLSPKYRTSLKVFFIIAALLFFADKFLGRYVAFDPLAFMISYLGSVWFGIISIAFTLFVFQYVLVLVIPARARSITLIFVILVFIVSAYAIYNGSRYPRIKELTIPIYGLSGDWSGFVIIQLSDLHLQKWRSEKWLRHVVEETNRQDPDLVLITGDLIEEHMDRCQKFVPVLREIKSKHGVFAITGNHEFYSGIENFLAFSKKAEIRVIRNEKVRIGHHLNIIGMDDLTGQMFSSRRPDLETLLEDCNPDEPIILLTHRPEEFEQLNEMGVDLQLSGHTHAGQIPPMDLIVFLVYKYPYGLYHHGSCFIYTTCGTGIWGPPMRLFSRSEIVRIVLDSQQ